MLTVLHTDPIKLFSCRPIPTKQFWQQMEPTHLLCLSTIVVTYSGVAGLPLGMAEAMKPSLITD